jgi:hypothetical protein
MASGSLTIRVRPLRIAFLVDPSDRAGLHSAIEASTFLWGGSFNPIIPAYKRTPKKWESLRVRRLPQPQEIITGYLDAFDPDIVVPAGVCEGRAFQVGHREVVKLSDLIGDISETHSPKYGVGFMEVLADFVDKELKFKRNDDLRLVFPKLPHAYGLFLASVFGKLPAQAEQATREYFGKHLDVGFPQISLDKFLELLEPHNFFPRRLTSWSLEYQPLREPQLFVCDATSPQDIIDYWNLRAAGYYVIPIPIQISSLELVKNFARTFIERNYRPYGHNQDMFDRTIVQRSRTVSEDVVKIFCDSLQVPLAENKQETKFMLRWWYPRIWDVWARENTHEGVVKPYAHEVDLRIPENEESLKLRSYDPKIKLFRAHSGEHRFANDFSFSFYGSKEPMAEVFPEGSRELSSAIGRVSYHDWRFSSSGPVFLASRAQDLIFLDLPRAEAVMTEWFRERGWKVSLSTSGRMASQLVKQLDGTSGVSLLAHKGVIELLGKLEKEGGMPREDVVARLNQVIAADGLRFNCARFLERLIEVSALRLGANIQCPICTRHNWYELDALKYQVRCRFCISDFDVPVHSPKEMIAWTYRAHGPFASSVSQGAFSVLLVLKFLSGRGSHDNGITPLFSYTAKMDGKELEADLTCLYKPSTWRATRTQVVHAECKSFNSFKQNDISRMKMLAREFAGSTLIFATLKEKLSHAEIVAIKAMAQTHRNKRLRGKANSPVIVLTGTELFSSDGAPECWRDKGGAYDKFSGSRGEWSDLLTIADATQQLYLGLPSWVEWSASEWEKKRSRGKAI